MIAELRNISKRFPGVQALDDVSVSFAAGSVHALMGENGAGKSTLGKILAGLYSPDQGKILIEGVERSFRSPSDAASAGVSMIHQELSFAENMTVAENLSLGDLPAKGIFLDRKELCRRAEEWLAAIGADIDPNLELGKLSIARQQMVQIAAGIGRGAKILIFDEPTSSLSRGEADRLLELILQLRAQGIACIYVSHRLEEISAISDTITVLRDGQLVGTRAASEVDRDELVRMMIGRDLAASLASQTVVSVGEEVLRVESLSSRNKFQDVSFSIRKGEIVGFAGLVGAGRTEVAEAIFGVAQDSVGKVWLHGREIPRRSPRSSAKRGVALVPEDRKRHGLVLSMNVRENVSLPTLDRFALASLIRRRRERSEVARLADQMRVKAPSLETGAAGLSGGNQQKLVLAKWLAAQLDLLIVDEPTRGVDVGAKAEIHALIREIAANGKAVMLISSELPELLSLSTRILVMRNGYLVGELPGGSTEEQAMRLMAGAEGTTH